MKIAALICRILLGLGFVVFGANIIAPFMPQPPFPPESPEARFMALMVPTHWMLLVGVVQLVGGALVLAGRTAPLGLVLLGPVLVNIIAFHVCLQDGAGVIPGLVFTLLEIFLIYAYRAHFKPLFATNAAPA